MKLRTVELSGRMAEIFFMGEYDSSLVLTLCFDDNEKLTYLWGELEQYIKLMIAEKLGLEEPLYKTTYSEGVWSEPDITEMVEGVDYDEDYVDRDLIPESNRDNS